MLSAVAENGDAICYATLELQTDEDVVRVAATQRTDATKVAAGRRMVAVLQRLAFVACFDERLALGGHGPSSAAVLFGSGLGVGPTQVFFDVDALWAESTIEACGRSAALLQLTSLNVIRRAGAQGWLWRDAQEDLAVGAAA